ncbi:MarR family winged helix-turn-helix transcriptional regulator [Pelosinus sp. sgz500959]|uniref:MarR family winged helix-turn-helix transcriptional regulator n=1 Tax=Pelosinus sp. sgz500959 TaxID=3242472 RepID=UPI00366E23E7
MPAHSKQLDIKHMAYCACGNVRKTTRTITQFYDRYLQSTGLRSTQCSLLINIYLHENISVSELGSRLLMDQTTVTRNINLLKKQGYITIIKEESDARKKSISITDEGAQKIAEAIPLWEQAQLQIEQGMGKERFHDFLKMLKELEQIVE